MNACLQCLSHTPELYEDVKDAEAPDTPEGRVLHQWRDLRALMWRKDCMIAPGGLSTAIRAAAQARGARLFTGFAQNDAVEFIDFLLMGCFHVALKKQVAMQIVGATDTDQGRLAALCYKALAAQYESAYSPIVARLGGISLTTVSGSDGRTLSTTAEPFTVLSVPVPQQPCTLRDCFSLYRQRRTLDGDNQYQTDAGDRVDASIDYGFWSFPDILVVQLSRFDSALRKNNTPVSFPEDDLDLSEYSADYDAAKYVYRLYGVCNHTGGLSGGHYTAHARAGPGENWSLFNDTEVRDCGPRLPEASPQAYCLFYRRK
jgi:ubiquitin C-terminal hydrolase